MADRFLGQMCQKSWFSVVTFSAGSAPSCRTQMFFCIS
jgi:hypothetical protein